MSLPTPDPAELAAAHRGDREAFQRVARMVFPYMRRWAMVELADPHLAADAAQDALIRWMRGASTYNPKRPFLPWLRAIVRNACRDQWSRLQRHHDPPDPFVAVIQPDPARAIDVRREAARARRAFGELPPRQREIFDLCDLQGHRGVDVAELLGISPSAVRVQLHLARKALRRRLLADGADIIPLLREAP